MTPPLTQSVRKQIVKITEMVYCRAYKSSSQDNLTGNGTNKIAFNAVDEDSGASFDTTNNKFTVPVAGLYHIVASVTLSSVIADKSYKVLLYKNNDELRSVLSHSSNTDNLTIQLIDEIFFLKDDYLEVYVTPNVGGGVNTVDLVTGLTGSIFVARLLTKEGIRQ